MEGQQAKMERQRFELEKASIQKELLETQLKEIAPKERLKEIGTPMEARISFTMQRAS